MVLDNMIISKYPYHNNLNILFFVSSSGAISQRIFDTLIIVLSNLNFISSATN